MDLKRELRLLDVFCIASGAMISSGIFVLPGLAFGMTGPSVFVSYFVAGLLAFTGMVSTIELTTAMPKAGGNYFFTTRTLGPVVGTIAGLLSWFSLGLKSAFALVGMSAFMVLLVPIDINIAAVALCLFFIILNMVGVKEASRFQIVLVLTMLALMVV
ncbi:MAG: amino acid permease [Spirochaetaceae bacterium]|nr:MAG: amino acid permease [Spirochaetaceae bacterium]